MREHGPAARPVSAPSASATGGGGPVSVASRAASVSLSTRSARAKGCRRNPSTSEARPRRSPHCGPPSSLSPEAVTSTAPADSVAEALGSEGSRGCGASNPDPMSATTGTGSAASADTGTEEVNPRTTKFDG